MEQLLHTLITNFMEDRIFLNLVIIVCFFYLKVSVKNFLKIDIYLELPNIRSKKSVVYLGGRGEGGYINFSGILLSF